MSSYSSQTCMSRQRLTFPDEEFSMAIHDAGMFNVKEINRLKILQDVIDRNLRLAKLRRCSALHHVIAADC